MNIPRFNDSRPASAKLFQPQVLAIVIFFLPLSSTWAQGTIQFGFEEFQIKDLPPFVTGQASVQDSESSIYVPTAAFEGQKFLVGYAGISIASPDGHPIESFRLRVFLGQLPQSLSPWYVTVGNQSLITRGVAEWQTFQGTFNSPVPSVNIQAYVSFETIPGYFGVDDVQFVTVPEPQTFWLIPLGFALIAFRPLLKCSIRYPQKLDVRIQIRDPLFSLRESSPRSIAMNFPPDKKHADGVRTSSAILVSLKLHALAAL